MTSYGHGFGDSKGLFSLSEFNVFYNISTYISSDQEMNEVSPYINTIHSNQRTTEC